MKKVKVIERYNDIPEGEIKEVGDIFEVDDKRAEHLKSEGRIEILKENKGKTEGKQ